MYIHMHWVFSPDMRTLRNREELLIHLTSDGTCKCGLRCPFQFEEQFSFDPLVLGLPDNGIPSDAQAACKVGHALLAQSLKSGGDTTTKERKSVAGEGMVPRLKQQRHRGRARHHKKQKHSGKRIPGGESEGVPIVQVAAGRTVPKAGSDLSEHAQKIEKVLRSPVSLAKTTDDGKKSDSVPESFQSPTKQDLRSLGWLPDISVRGLLTRLPGSSSPSPKRVKRAIDRRSRERSEEKQKPTETALRLFPKCRELNFSGERRSPSLTEVLSGRSVSEIVAGKRGNVGTGEGGGGVADRGCELKVSIDLGGSDERREMAQKEEKECKEEEKREDTEPSSRDLAAKEEHEQGNRGMGALESDPGNRSSSDGIAGAVSSETDSQNGLGTGPECSSMECGQGTESGQASTEQVLPDAGPLNDRVSLHSDNQTALTDSPITQSPPPHSPPPHSPPPHSTQHSSSSPHPSSHPPPSDISAFSSHPAPSLPLPSHETATGASPPPNPPQSIPTSTPSLPPSQNSSSQPPTQGVRNELSELLLAPTDFLPPASSMPPPSGPLQSSPTNHPSLSLSSFLVERLNSSTPQSISAPTDHPPPQYPSQVESGQTMSEPVSPPSSCPPPPASSHPPSEAANSSSMTAPLPSKTSETPPTRPQNNHSPLSTLPESAMPPQPAFPPLQEVSGDAPSSGEGAEGEGDHLSSLKLFLSELCGSVQGEGDGSALRLPAAEEFSRALNVILNSGRYSSPTDAHPSCDSDSAALPSEVPQSVPVWSASDTLPPLEADQTDDVVPVQLHVHGGDHPIPAGGLSENGVINSSAGGGGGGVAMMTAGVHVPFAPKVAVGLENKSRNFETDLCSLSHTRSKSALTSELISTPPQSLTRLPLRALPKRDSLITNRLAACKQADEEVRSAAMTDSTGFLSSVYALLPSVSSTNGTSDSGREDEATSDPPATETSNSTSTADVVALADSDASPRSEGHETSDDSSSFPISELSSLTPDSHLQTPPHGLSSSVPVSSFLRQVRRSPYGDVPIKECRIELKPIGREWTPRKRRFSECDAVLIERTETLKEMVEQPPLEEDEDVARGNGAIEEEGKGRGSSELAVLLHPKRLKFSEQRGKSCSEVGGLEGAVVGSGETALASALDNAGVAVVGVASEEVGGASGCSEQPFSDEGEETGEENEISCEVEQRTNEEETAPLSDPSDQFHDVHPIDQSAQDTCTEAQPELDNPETVQPSPPITPPPHTNKIESSASPKPNTLTASEDVLAESPGSSSAENQCASNNIDSLAASGGREKMNELGLDEQHEVVGEGGGDSRDNLTTPCPLWIVREEEGESVVGEVVVSEGQEETEVASNLDSEMESASVGDTAEEREEENTSVEQEQTLCHALAKPQGEEEAKGVKEVDVVSLPSPPSKHSGEGREVSPDHVETEILSESETVVGTLDPITDDTVITNTGSGSEMQTEAGEEIGHNNVSAQEEGGRERTASEEFRWLHILAEVAAEAAPKVEEDGEVSDRVFDGRDEVKQEESSLELECKEELRRKDSDSNEEDQGMSDSETDRERQSSDSEEKVEVKDVRDDGRRYLEEVSGGATSPEGRVGERELQEEDEETNMKIQTRAAAETESPADEDAEECLNEKSIYASLTTSLTAAGNRESDRDVTTQTAVPEREETGSCTETESRVEDDQASDKLEAAAQEVTSAPLCADRRGEATDEEAANDVLGTFAGQALDGQRIDLHTCSGPGEDSLSPRPQSQPSNLTDTGDPKTTESEAKFDCGFGTTNKYVYSTDARSHDTGQSSGDTCTGDTELGEDDAAPPKKKKKKNIFRWKGRAPRRRGRASEGERSPARRRETRRSHTGRGSGPDSGMESGQSCVESDQNGNGTRSDTKDGETEMEVEHPPETKSLTDTESKEVESCDTRLEPVKEENSQPTLASTPHPVTATASPSSRRSAMASPSPSSRRSAVASPSHQIPATVDSVQSQNDAAFTQAGDESSSKNPKSEQKMSGTQTCAKNRETEVEVEPPPETNTLADAEDKEAESCDLQVEPSESVEEENSQLTSSPPPLQPVAAATSPSHHIPTKVDSFQSQNKSATTRADDAASSSKNLHLAVSVPLSKVQLVHHQSIHCYSSSEFQSGDVVWARAAQLPGWPGAVIEHKEWKRDRLKPAATGKVNLQLVKESVTSCNPLSSLSLSLFSLSLSLSLSPFLPTIYPPHYIQRWVRWYGDNTVSLVSEKAIQPLREGLKRRMQRKTSKGLQRAINVALKAQRKREKQVCYNYLRAELCLLYLCWGGVRGGCVVCNFKGCFFLLFWCSCRK